MKRNPALDGLRGLAALMVLVQHAIGDYWPADWFNLGFAGVRLFFVLSGALITYVLYQARDEADGVGASYWSAWWRFAARRALRTLPIAYLALILAWQANTGLWRQSWWWHVTFTSNIGNTLDPSFFSEYGHFWTLALEEQIYLLWPLLVFMLPVTIWPRFTILAVQATVLLRIAFQWNELPIFFLDAFAIGGFIGWRAAVAQPASPRWMAAMGAVCWLPALLISSPVSTSLQETGAILLAAAAVTLAWNRPTLPWLSARPIVWIGTISYGLYVWHLAMPICLEYFGWRMPRDMIGHASWIVGWGFATAIVSWYAIERPILSLKDRLPQLRRSELGRQAAATVRGSVA